MNESHLCSNFTDLHESGSVGDFYMKLFVFSGMLISVIFIPTHLFLLYVTDNAEGTKGKNFMSLMFTLLIKYSLILLNTTVEFPNLGKFPNFMILVLVYVHLSATCWFCIMSAHSLNIVKKRIWKTYNVRWISISVSSMLGWVLPCFFLLFAYVLNILVEDQICKNYCEYICSANIFFAVFEIIKILLFLKSIIDVIRVRYHRSYMTPTETADEAFINDLDYINLCIMLCIILFSTTILEIFYYFLRIKSAIGATSAASSVEAVLVVMGTLWWKKCFSSSSNN